MEVFLSQAQQCTKVKVIHSYSDSRLLQLTFLGPIRWTDDTAAVCLECCCTSRVGRSTVWPHHAGATPAALASGSEVDLTDLNMLQMT